MRTFNPGNSAGDPSNARAGRLPLVIALASCVLLGAALFVYAEIRLGQEARPITPAERDMALTVHSRLHPDQSARYPGSPDLRTPEWAGPQPSTEIYARSAILVAADTGEILFEKNADEQIPPASMTKLAAMYTAFRALDEGEISLADRVDLPPESWAKNIPPGSSLMFLGPGQRVTVSELLLGMAVVSGNDAAIALADHVSRSVPAFVDRMNREMERIGLSRTRFVEPSGLSEHNVTTAREFADFSLVYLNEHPEALALFHSRTNFEYPLRHNLPEGTQGPSIAQRATNRLLDTLPGCDGLKTGFIYESGYNISLTAKRGDTRYLAVLMGGPGSTSSEGNELRSRDGTSLIEWAFGNYRLLRLEGAEGVSLTVWGGLDRALTAIPAGGTSLTVPSDLADRIGSNGIVPVYIAPESVAAPVQAGDVLGRIEWRSGDLVVHGVPLVADRSVQQGSIPYRALESLASLVGALIGERPESGYRP